MQASWGLGLGFSPESASPRGRGFPGDSEILPGDSPGTAKPVDFAKEFAKESHFLLKTSYTECNLSFYVIRNISRPNFQVNFWISNFLHFQPTESLIFSTFLVHFFICHIFGKNAAFWHKTLPFLHFGVKIWFYAHFQSKNRRKMIIFDLKIPGVPGRKSPGNGDSENVQSPGSPREQNPRGPALILTLICILNNADVNKDLHFYLINSWPNSLFT